MRGSRSPQINRFDARSARRFRMLAAILTQLLLKGGESLHGAAHLIWKHPQVLAELQQLMQVLEGRIDHVQSPLATHPDVPLRLHSGYTRREIVWKRRNGGRWLPVRRVDLLTVTFDKTAACFPPATRCRDFAISPRLPHW
jgi:hypothetical protein